MAPLRKLRVLCLHGYQQNAAVLRSKMGGVCNATKSMVDYVFVDGPLVVPGTDGMKGWLSKRDDPWPDPNDLEKSLATINEVVKKEGPFDGVFGFSQGVSIAVLLLQLKECPQAPFKVDPAVHFKFALFVCGLKSWKYRIDTVVDIPSLHLIGLTDRVVAPERARAVRRFFKTSASYEYYGGHRIPSSSDVKTVIREFIFKCQTAICSDSLCSF